jgi:hypothetical protein
MPPEVAALYADGYETDPSAADRVKRLATLKGENTTRLPKRVRPYTARWDKTLHRVIGLEAWGRQVLEDVWFDLVAATATSRIDQHHNPMLACHTPE